VKGDEGKPLDKSGPQPEIRTCPVCGTKFSAAEESDFCPVCVLRGALTDESLPTEPLHLSSGMDEGFSDDLLSLPRQFENYDLIIGADGKAVELGRGAMGVTYKAIDTNLHRYAALKIISPQYISDQWIRERFVREARAAASLRHEHIASVYHLGSTGFPVIYFYAMEYLEGQTLEQVLRSRGPLPVELALEITSQVAAALAAAHQRQLVHRDIKPANLIVSFDQQNRPMVKVIDFGLVKLTADHFDDSSVSTPGILLGTPHYASPEQFSGGQVDTRSDIYSLGVTLWHMLTNTTPFSGSPAQVAGQHLQAPLPIDRLRHLSLPVVSLVAHLLEKDPDNRPQTAEELLTLLSSTIRSLGDPLVVRRDVRKPRLPSRSLKVRSKSYPARGGDLHRLLEPWDFTPFLVEKFKGFIGREWLFQEIDEWRSKDHPAALLIVGEPGIGKSAVVAALVHRNLEGQVLAYHCCRTDTPATLEPAGFVRSLASMFSARLAEYTATLECSSVINALRRADTDPVSAFEAAVLAPLHRIRQPEKNRYYLLIDALDESLTRSHPPTIFDVLRTRLDRFPAWLGLIATTRNDPSVLNPLRSLRVHIISAQDPKNQDDVRRFIRCRLRQAPFHEKAKANRKILASLEDDLLRSSAGNFLFVRTALDAIESGQLSFDHIENLPPGLSSLYEIFFRRLFPDPANDFGRSRKVLETIAAAREPLTREQIAAATGLDPEEELPLILSHLASFVPASEGRYALFHKSLFDWLTGWDFPQDQPFAGAYYVNPRKGSAQLADSCWAEYQRGYSQISTYCLRHLPAHLYQLRRFQLSSALLRDFHFLQAKLEATDPSALVADYEYLPQTADLRLVQLAIQLSAHVLARDYRQLAGQLTGRLLGNSAPDIQALLKGAAENKAWPWLQPLKPSLAPPGGPLIRTLEGHTSWVHAVTLTPDGRCAISGSGDGTLRVWDLEGNLSVRSLARHTGPIKAVAVTPDGRRAVSASSDHTLRVWDLESGQSLRTLRGHCNPVSLVTITSHGCRAVSASSGRTLRVWDLQSGRSLRTLVGHTKQVNALTITADGRHAISASSDQTLRVWDLENGHLVRTLEGHLDSVNAVAVTSDGRCAISASADHTLRVWDLKNGQLVRTLEGHSDSVNAVVVTPDGHCAISASADHTLRVWDLDRGRSVHTLEGHTNSVTAVVLSADGRRAISGSADHTLRVWNLKTGKSVCTLEGHTDWVTAAVVTPDGRRAISGSADHTLRIWDLGRDQSVHTLAGQTDNISRVLLTPDGRRATVASDCDVLCMWDVESGQIMHTLVGHTDWVTAAAVTPDGRHLISGSADHSLRLWNLENGQSVRTLAGHTALVTAVAVTPDARYAISASADHTLRIWDLRSGQLLRTLTGETDLISAVALTPDGKGAVWGSDNGALLTWNSESNETARICPGNGEWVTSIAATPGGQYAISASVAKILRVWDLQNLQFIRALEGHTDLVNAVAITADGHHAVSASADHSLRVWDLETGDCIAAFSGEGPMLRCSIAPDGRTITARDKSGRGHVLRLEGLDQASLA
jgi:WD40 repeat protein/serine/threonine protein kinase